MANLTPWQLFTVAEDIVGTGDAPWGSPENALAPDTQEATSGPIGINLPNRTTTLHRVSQADLGAVLPPGFRLHGIEVEVRGRWTGALDGIRTVPVDSVVGAAVRSSLGSCSLPVNLSGTCVKGGPTNTMGCTAADVINTGFGFQLFGKSTSQNASGNTLRIDSVRVRIHWGDPPEFFARGRSRVRAALCRGLVL